MISEMTELSGEIGSHPSDERWNPTLLTEPRTLYRAVSLAELKSIWSGAVIEGGRNTFNTFDDRPWVFFGDRITPILIWQGEDIERLADYRVIRMYASEEARLTAERKVIAEDKRKWVEKAQRRRKRVVDFASIDFRRDDDWYDIDFGRDDDWYDIHDREREWREERDRVEAQFKWNIRNEMETVRADLEGASFTSAILETRPLSGCRVYAGHFGEDGKDLEYGFLPGEVKLTDIVSIHLVLNREVIDCLPMSEFDALMMGELDVVSGAASEEVAHTAPSFG